GILLSLTFTAAAQQPPGRWSSGPPLPTPRSEDAVAVLDGRIYVIAGYVPAGPQSAVLEAMGDADVDGSLVEELDVASGRWSTRAPLPRGMNHVAAIGFAGKIYTFGGFVRQNRDPVADAYAYDRSTDRWSAMAPLPEALGSISLAVLNDNIH